jgi:hypothetical protein
MDEQTLVPCRKSGYGTSGVEASILAGQVPTDFRFLRASYSQAAMCFEIKSYADAVPISKAYKKLVPLRIQEPKHHRSCL